MLGNNSYRFPAQLLLIACIISCALYFPLRVTAQVATTPIIEPSAMPEDASTPADPSYVIIQTSSASISENQTATTTSDDNINSQQLSEEPVATPTLTPTPIPNQTATESGMKTLKAIMTPKLSGSTVVKKHKRVIVIKPTIWSWLSGIFKK